MANTTEKKAIEAVKKHFIKEGWYIDDVPKGKGYDLLAKKGKQKKRIEVKGRQQKEGENTNTFHMNKGNLKAFQDKKSGPWELWFVHVSPYDGGKNTLLRFDRDDIKELREINWRINLHKPDFERFEV